MAMRKEAIEAKWIQMAGKPNKDFLAKPKRERKRIGNMTIDNAKDKPDLPRTDDINLICGVLCRVVQTQGDLPHST
jgi:hypothetical protein